MIGLDTTAIIDLFKKDARIRKIIEESKEDISSSIINYQEIMFGLDFHNPKHKMEEGFYDNFFDKIFLFSLDKNSAKKASEIFFDLQKKGENIEKLDSMTAGIFLINGVNKIITKNIKHFEKIPGIEVISY